MAKEKELECPWCHKTFVTAHHSQKYCTKECYREHKAILMKAIRVKHRKRKHKPISTIDKIAAAAREEGLTYGQYVAKHNL